MRSAILFGTTGLVGGKLLRRLLDDPNYNKVTVVGRSSVNINHPKLSEQKISFDHLAQCVDQLEADDIYWCLGSTIKKSGSQKTFRQIDFEYPVTVATSAKPWCKSFILVSALGADAKAKIFYSRVKGELEQALKKLNLQQLIIVRPSLILGERQELRLGESIAQAVMPYIDWLIPNKKMRAINADRIAECMLMLRRGERNIDDLEFEIS